jgi:hypothetical protein
LIIFIKKPGIQRRDRYRERERPKKYFIRLFLSGLPGFFIYPKHEELEKIQSPLI